MAKEKEVTTEVKSFFSRSTVHGFSYFCDDSTALEKFFWVLSTTIMFMCAIYLILQANTDWNNHPTTTRPGVTNLQASDIQAPTITICPAFTINRWGFLRNMLNLLKFQCQGQEDCQRTDEIRQFLKTSEGVFPTRYAQGWMNSVYSSEPGWWETSDEGILAPYGPPLLIKSYVAEKLDQLQNDGPIYDMISEKYMSRANNFDIYKFLDMDITLPHLHHLNVSYTYGPIDIEDRTLRDAILVTNRVLAMALPGKLGTIIENNDFPSMAAVTWFKARDIHDFWGKLFPFTDEIFDGLANAKDLGVSVLELAPLLDPVPSYPAYHKYPRQFPHTAHKQVEKTQPDYNSQKEAWLTVAAPSFFSIRNYFGKLLTPHLKAVMEVMYHCMLRTRTLDESRYRKPHLKDLYGNLATFMKFPLADPDETLEPRWIDYKAHDKTSYWLPYDHHSFARVFEQSPDRSNNPFIPETAEELDIKEKIMDELKKTHQHQQMMLHCRWSGDSSQSCRHYFEPVLTDNGICHAFNSHGMHQTVDIDQSSYLQTFVDVFEPSLENKTIYNNQNVGKPFRMFMMLDNFEDRVLDPIRGSFKVGVTNAGSYMTSRDISVDVDPGMLTKITVSPQVINSTKAFHDLDKEVRKCLYPGENPNPKSLFKAYSQASCTFECRLEFASKACNCTPWNYPQFTLSNQFEMCDGVLSLCFKRKMEEHISAEGQCGCLPDCDSVSFDIKEYKNKLNYDRECDTSIEIGDDFLEDDFSTVYSEKVRHLDGEEFYLQTRR